VRQPGQSCDRTRHALRTGNISVTQHLDINDRTIQYITVPAGTTTKTIVLTIIATVPPGNPGLNHTPISEISVG